MSYIHELATKAKASAQALATRTAAEKNAMLEEMALALEAHADEIAAANQSDVERAKASGLKDALVDRLTLSEARFKAMVDGVRQVEKLADPVGEEIWKRERPSGIVIRKVRVPLGVIAVVFESRPNVFIDTAALCLKTGNAVILRGGKEAYETNLALSKCVPESVLFVEHQEHECVTELVRAVGLVDVAIPRGGERLVRAMCEAALVPVLKHYKGVCHIYVDDRADLGMALTILDNAKTQRPGVCNAAEGLLVNERIAPLFLPMVKAWAADRGVTLHQGEAGSEYLALEINVETVKDVDAAIAFINEHGSHHSDSIITADAERARRFLAEVDSAAVYHNVSTRFTDGAEFGMGAEIGISTDKLHARGPMGLEELTTYKYQITGDGVIRK